MGFLAPSLLFGGLAISVPLILHFFYRARYRRQPWAAMTFLKKAIEQTSRRIRFQELLLLLLRCVLLLLLAFALARPTLSGTRVAGRGDSVDAILVFDTSMSMMARDGEKTRLERAKDAAFTILDNLPPNSTVQIVTCADRSSELGPRIPTDFDQARETIKQIEATSLATDMLPGLNEAHQMFDRGGGTNKEIYLLTDVQRSGWEKQSAAIRSKCDEIRQRATLLIIRCGSPARQVPNVAITDITYPGGIPHTGTRMPFTVLIRNTGKVPVRNLSVTLEIDGKAADKEQETVAEINPDETLPITLTAKLDEAGSRIITAHISGDDLPGDNRMDKLIFVRDQVRVLLIDGTPDLRDPRESASHYVRNAILPVSLDQQGDYYVRVTVASVEEAGPELLGKSDVCMLLNVPASNADRPGVSGLSPPFVERLAEFLKAGGGLIIGCGDNVIPERYNAVLGSRGAKILPFDLNEPLTTTLEKPFKIAADSAETPSFLARFRDEPFRTVTSEVDLIKVIGIRQSEREIGHTLLRLTDQQPLIVAKTIGEGECIFVATSLDARWGNWPAKTGSFLSLMQFSLSHLTGKAARGSNRIAGEPLVWQPQEATGSFDVLTPDGKRLPLGKAVLGHGGRLTVTAANTTKAGIYQLGLVTDEPMKGPRFAVSPDLSETDNLELISDDEIEQMLGFRPVLLQAGTGGEASIAEERSKREWTIWALLILFALAATESVWAWYCGKAF